MSAERYRETFGDGGPLVPRARPTCTVELTDDKTLDTRECGSPASWEVVYHLGGGLAPVQYRCDLDVADTVRFHLETSSTQMVMARRL